MPLRHRGEPIGLLNVLSRTPNAFTSDDLNTLELLAVVLASMMSHASEYEALARFRTIFESSTVGIVRVDRDGRLIEANPAMEQMLGYEKNELTGRNFSDIHAGEEVERQAKIIDDPIIAEYVNRIGQNLLRNSDAKVPFTIKVIDSEDVNAFALPGRASWTPVRSPVVASTASIITVTG